jgi:glucose/arabinose dehydrogenase
MYKPYDYHWGGHIAFGPDGYLWVSVGDGGFERGDAEPGSPQDGPGDPDDRAQDLGQLFGKILRIDPRDPDGRGHGKRYGIPRDNPFVRTRGARKEIWAYGLRNPWRWSFDRVTGDLWIADVGMWSYEEIDRARAPKRGKGANYGWRRMEGPACYNPPRGCQRGVDLTMPLATYAHETTSVGYQCAAIGGYVYRGRAYPALRSWYVFGDYCSGAIFLLDSGGRNHQRIRLGMDTDFKISAMGEDAAGELYVVDYGKGNTIYRIEGRRAR